MATLSPGMTVKEISCKIVSGVAPLSTVLPKPITSTTALSALSALSAMRYILFILSLFIASPAAHAAGTILVFGDSLSAGYGIRTEQSWPMLLDQRLKQKRLDYSVANLSISGETTAGGRSRFNEAVNLHQPRVVVIALGANVSSAHDGRCNVMAASWAMPLDFDPPKVAVVVDARSFTRELIEGSGEFVLSIPTKAIADKVLAVGSQSGREMDKFAAYSVGTSPATKVQAPLIDGCVAWLECRVVPEEHNQKRYA